MEEKIIFVLFSIVMIVMSLLFIRFIIATADLYKFRSCYNDNFQHNECQKYLNY